MDEVEVEDVSEWDNKTVSEAELINKIMSEVRNLLKTSGYSDRAIEYYENHLNVGIIENASLWIISRLFYQRLDISRRY